MCRIRGIVPRDRCERLHQSLRRSQPDGIVRAADGDDKDIFAFCQCAHRTAVGGITRDRIHALGEIEHIAPVANHRSDGVSAARRFIRYHPAHCAACAEHNNLAHSYLLNPRTGIFLKR